MLYLECQPSGSATETMPWTRDFASDDHSICFQALLAATSAAQRMAATSAQKLRLSVKNGRRERNRIRLELNQNMKGII